VVFDDPNCEHRPDPAIGYGPRRPTSCSRGARPAGRADIRAFSLHPGTIVETNFSRNMPEGVLQAVGMIDEHGRAVLDPDKGWKSVEQGAATSVWCATSPQLDGLGGVYAQDCDLATLLDHTDPDVIAAAARFGPAALGVMDYALNPDHAERLWALSEQLISV
jgi:hypothetical protein